MTKYKGLIFMPAFCLLFAGCEFYDKNEDKLKDESRSWGDGGIPPNAGGPVEPDAGGWADEVPYHLLKWTFVGPDGQYPEAVPEGVLIKDLRLHKHYFTFKFERNLSAWGYSKEHYEFACAFVKKEDGTWIGGKFDWISSAEDSRIYSNMLSGYNGWRLGGVPNPCEFAFVVVDTRKNRRSNVLTGLWHR